MYITTRGVLLKFLIALSFLFSNASFAKSGPQDESDLMDSRYVEAVYQFAGNHQRVVKKNSIRFERDVNGMIRHSRFLLTSGERCASFMSLLVGWPTLKSIHVTFKCYEPGQSSLVRNSESAIETLVIDARE